jgi:hypothetical protein
MTYTNEFGFKKHGFPPYFQNSGDNAINNYNNDAEDDVKDDKSALDGQPWPAITHNSNPTFIPDNVVDCGFQKTTVHSKSTTQQCYREL